MGDIHYMTTEMGIEDISDRIHEWEERLDIPIGKKEKEHHYYTKDDIGLLECVEKLSCAGVSDKELKEMVPDLIKAKEQKIEVRGAAVASENITTNMSEVNMSVIMERALQNNNILLERGICDMVTDSIKKEMTYLLLAKDQVEEERFKRLDTLIRQQQQNRKESVKKSISWFNKERFGFTG